MRAGRAWKETKCATGLQPFPAESELEILPSVSKIGLLFHCTWVIPKEVLSHKQHYLLLTKGNGEPFFRFLAFTGRGASSPRPATPPLPWGGADHACLWFGESSYHDAEQWFRFDFCGHIPAFRIVSSEVQEKCLVSVTHSETGNLKRVHPSFLPSRPAELQSHRPQPA